MTGARSRPCGTRARAGLAHKARQDAFCRLKGRLRELVWVGGCVTVPVAWASDPSAPPGRASGRGYAEVYTDWRKWALDATTARMQSAPFGHVTVASLMQNALFRDVEVASPAQNALFRRVRFSSPAQTWSHLTQRRILRRRSHVKAQSAPATSRKGALCTPDLTEKRSLWPAHTQNALFRDVARPECAFPWRRRHRMHFSVRVRSQNALFRRVRFSSPAQTWSHLTQRRILRRRSHVKAQSAPAASRKSALCTPDLTEKRTLWPAHTQNALFRESDTPRMRLSVSCRLQSGAFAYTVATRFAEASTHTNPRRALKGQHWSIRER